MITKALKSPGKGLTRSFFYWFLIISLVPMASLSWITYRKSEALAVTTVTQSMNGALSPRAYHVENFFRERLSDLRLQAKEPTNLAFLRKLKANWQASGQPLATHFASETRSSWLEAEEPALADWVQIKEYLNLYLVDEQGNVLYSVLPDEVGGTNILTETNANATLGKLCYKALRQEQSVSSELVMSDQGVAGLYMARPMKAGERTIGMMVFFVSMKPVDDVIQLKIAELAGSRCFLVGSDRLLRSGTDTKDRLLSTQQINSPLIHEWIEESDSPDLANRLGELKFYKNHSGTDVVGCALPIDGLIDQGHRWLMVAEVDEAVAFKPHIAYFQEVALVGLITLLIVLFLSILIANRIARPIEQMIRWVGQVGMGNLDPGELKIPDNELGILYEGFDQVVASLRELTDLCEAVSLGDFSNNITPRSENDPLSVAINSMTNNLREVVSQADEIAGGNFETRIQLKSERDELGMALQNMTRQLTEAAGENMRVNWTQEGEGRLNELLRGEQEIAVFCRKIITFLAEYLNAQVGALFIREGEQLALKASYAYQVRKNIDTHFAMGEGIVGQAALEGQTIILTEVPADYVTVQSGLGAHPPRVLVVAPFFFEQELKGVIELGSFNTIEEDQRIFLERAGRIIGIGVHTTQARDRMQGLLAQTQRQATELGNQQAALQATNSELEEQTRALRESESRLQLQQEELRQANEELEEQTKALRESESRLQQQQEELRQANEELEEQTEALKDSESRLQHQQEELRQVNEELEERARAQEKQTQEIQLKNDELEKARSELFTKARDLEMTGRYKSEFMANMSHELRTPLNSLLILSQLLAANKNGNLDEKQVEFAKTIYQSGSDLLNLINEVLDLSKIEAGRMSIHIAPMFLDSLVKSLNRKFQHMAIDRNLDFVVELKTDLPEFIETDNQRMEQILRNLIANSLKFTEQGEVRVVIFQPEAGVAFQREELTSENVLGFSVVDSGVGIPEEKQRQIFEAFQQADGTTSRKYGGTGLGLSISRELARLLGGEIHLKSVPGKGSTFTLFLPLQQQNLEPEPAAAPEQEEPIARDEVIAVEEPQSEMPKLLANEEPTVQDDRDQCKPGERIILIVEDDRRFAETLMSLTRERGFKALVSHSGENALYLADYYKPSAILLDIALPGMDGMSVMSRLKDNSEIRHIPVHFISAADKDTEAMKMGAAGYLKKPVTMGDLDTAFNRIEHIISKPVKRLLLVEDDNALRQSIYSLIGGSDVDITQVGDGKKAVEALKNDSFDCMILDLKLPDISGFDLLVRLRGELDLPHLPVIVYTGQELTESEKTRLDSYAESVIVKSASSPELLLDETILFLHRVESHLSDHQRRMVRMVHDKESIFKDKQILLVDDDMRNVFALTSVLEEKGMVVTPARNGRDALDQLEAVDRFHLILMDIMMPEMDGYEAMRRIRGMPKYRDVPIIALTAKAMKGDRKKCIDAGANDYMAKPVDTVQLLSLMRVWLY